MFTAVGEPSPHPQEYREMQSFMVDGGDRFGVSCLCFDTQELLWMGNQGVGLSVQIQNGIIIKRIGEAISTCFTLYFEVKC